MLISSGGILSIVNFKRDNLMLFFSTCIFECGLILLFNLFNCLLSISVDQQLFSHTLQLYANVTQWCDALRFFFYSLMMMRHKSRDIRLDYTFNCYYSDDLLRGRVRDRESLSIYKLAMRCTRLIILWA